MYEIRIFSFFLQIVAKKYIFKGGAGKNIPVGNYLTISSAKQRKIEGVGLARTCDGGEYNTCRFLGGLMPFF